MMKVSGFRYRMPVGGRIFLALFVLLIQTGVLLTGCSDSQAVVSPVEQREHALNKSLMCPVCPGESIDQSQVALAVQMRGVVREKLAAGWTDEQVREFFVERYGPSVLLEPPTEGISLAVWLVPPIGVVAAIGVFIVVLRSMRRRPEPVNDNVIVDAVSDEDLHPYFERIEESMSGMKADGQDVRDG